MIASLQEHAPRKSIPSLIKWTGSKRSQAHRIAGFFPPHRRYYEPFLGGGALLYLAAKPGAVGADIYRPLIELWQHIQRSPAQVSRNYRAQWKQLQRDLPAYFYAVRERFNRHKSPLDLNFLMRTCVNGIVRFNDAEEFNNSFHLSRPGMNPDRFDDIVHHWSQRITAVRFQCADYTQIVDEAGREDFIYFDPPYAGNKQRYAADLDLARFLSKLEELNQRGVRWALSFDGRRGARDLTHPMPKSLYRQSVSLDSGNSAVHKVLNGPVEMVSEMLYLNY